MRKITASLNGVKTIKELATSWDEVSFEKFLQLKDVKLNEELKILSILLEMEEATLQKATIQNLVDEVLPVLKFMESPLPSYLPKTILGHPIPKDLNLEEWNRYADLKLLIEQGPEKEEETTTEHVRRYCDMCAVYAMPDYMDSTDEQKDEFAKKFLKAPCWEVMAVGNFTMMKWLVSKQSIVAASLPTIPILKRWRLAFRIWRKSMALMVRFYLWNRKLRSLGIRL